MPRASKKSSYRKKRPAPYRRRRSYRKYSRRRASARTTSVRSRTSPIPDRFFTKLKYCHIGTLTTAGTPVAHIFKMNSLYDPDHTQIVNHQPFGRDQLATLYNHYRVYGCKYSITITNLSSAYAMDVAVVLKDTNALSTDMQTIAEKPYVQFRTLGMSGSSSGTTVIKGYCNNPKIMGVSKERFRVDDVYTATSGNNPTKIPYLHVYAHGQAGLQCKITVHLQYLSCFYERVALAGS